MEFDTIISKKKSECTREYIDKIVRGSIVLVDVINCGSFGDIYLGQDRKTGKEYAVKFNKNDTEKGVKNFFKEFDIMKTIEGKGLFPTCSIELKDKNEIGKDVLIMEKLGINAYDLFRICNKKLTPATICVIIQQFIMRVRELHRCGIVHRDIKPENFCLANPHSRDFFLIDFGLSKDFIDSKGNHRVKSDGEGFVGTPRYASRNAHKGRSRSRRHHAEPTR